jgi:ribosome modulation factor
MARKPTAPKTRNEQAAAPEPEGDISVSANGIAANGHAEATEPPAPSRALTNVSQDTIREYGRRLRSAKADTEEKRIAAKAAQKAVSSCVGFERAILKDAKRNGINTERLVQMVDLMSRDPEEIGREMAELNWYLEAMGHTTDTQLSILDYAAKINEGMAKGEAIIASMAGDDLEQIKELGFRAGKAGKPASDNPYDDDGSPEHLAWLGSWRDGQADNMGPLAGGASDAAAEGANVH